MTVKDHKCPRCGCYELYFSRLDESKVGLYCAQCGKWVKWADKEERKRMNLPSADVRDGVEETRKEVFNSAEKRTVSPEGKPLIHFKGDIGEFDYNPELFRMDLWSGKHRLVYIGSETDGSRIRIPDGIISCDGMFLNNVWLKTPPVIPVSARSFNFTFCGCSSLREVPVLPEGTCKADTKCMLNGCVLLNREDR